MSDQETCIEMRKSYELMVKAAERGCVCGGEGGQKKNIIMGIGGAYQMMGFRLNSGIVRLLDKEGKIDSWGGA